MAVKMSQSSVSRGSMSNGVRVRRAASRGTYGVPTYCVCGGEAIVHTSHTANNPGRRFFTCRMSEDGGTHIWKWWDEAIMEEVTNLKLEIQEASERYQMLLRRIGSGQTSVVDPTGKIFSDEIVQIKILLAENEGEIVRMKELLAKRGEGMDVKYVMLAGFVVVAVFCYFFK